MGNDKKSHSHHLVPLAVYYKTIGALLVLTVVTVGASYVDLGSGTANMLVAMGIASLKASLVMSFFMGLKYDNWVNRAFIGSSFVALALFIGFSASDSWTREYGTPVKVKAAGVVLSYDELKKLEQPSDELTAKGKELFAMNCAVCHGAEGKGDGAGGAALNPKPRNFGTAASDWKHGNTAGAVFATLTYGVPGTGMAAYKSLGVKERWALAHFVVSMGDGHPSNKVPALYEKALKEESAGAEAGGGETKTPIPVGFAIQRMLQERSSK